MGADENRNQPKGYRCWMILGVALLIAGILTAMLWLKPPDSFSEIQDPQTSNAGQSQEDGPDVSSNMGLTISTDEGHTTDSWTESTDPGNHSADVPVTEPTAPDDDRPTSSVTVPPEQQLICKDYGLYNGAFIEDGSDEPVENVAAILVTNGSEQYLDVAKLTYEIDGKEAVFMVTGLPAGSSAWVLENTRLTASSKSEFRHKNTVTSFRNNAINTLDGVDLEFNGTMLKVTNSTDQTFQAFTVYYKVLHDDGNYLGGIAYMVSFDDLEPGQSVEKIAGHFRSDRTQIVRIGYL